MFTTWSPRLLSVLRIVAALLFVEHGLMLLAQFPVRQSGVPYPLPLLQFIGGWIELVGGLLLLVGLFTRAAAFVCSGQMAVAYFVVHAKRSFWPGINEGGEAILDCFIFLYLAVAGGGSWSLDALSRRSIQHR